jgi:hypothetical protein
MRLQIFQLLMPPVSFVYCYSKLVKYIQGRLLISLDWMAMLPKVFYEDLISVYAQLAHLKFLSLPKVLAFYRNGKVILSLIMQVSEDIFLNRLHGQKVHLHFCCYQCIRYSCYYIFLEAIPKIYHL